MAEELAGPIFMKIYIFFSDSSESDTRNEKLVRVREEGYTNVERRAFVSIV